MTAIIVDARIVFENGKPVACIISDEDKRKIGLIPERTIREQSELGEQICVKLG